MGTSAAVGVDWLRISASIVLVFVLLGAMLWMLRRMKHIQTSQGGVRKLEVLETISVGPRQKIALLRVGSRQVLVGMSATQFTALGQWDDSPAPKETALET
jgi:flagellar protein FliO/FliZ